MGPEGGAGGIGSEKGARGLALVRGYGGWGGGLNPWGGQDAQTYVHLHVRKDGPKFSTVFYRKLSHLGPQPKRKKTICQEASYGQQFPCPA